MYYKTKKSVEEYIRLAKDANGGGLIQKLHEYLPSDSVLLEIGSGPGTDFKILKQLYKVVGSDFSKEFLIHLTSTYPTDEFLNIDATTLNTDKKFDGIYSNKVLQHLSDEALRKSVARQADVLSDHGIICHSFWKGAGNEVFKGLFVNYQTSDSLNHMFKAHFEILLLESYCEFEKGDSLVLIGKKK
jgi:cyclopropane fatty-acyl-phospholipid synthase-like methyltransferase